MKYFFALAILIFLAGFTLAVATLKPPGPPGTTTIRWATDPNPARTVQVNAFSKLRPEIHVEVDTGEHSRLVIQCATGVGPDVMDLSDDQMQSMAEAGVLLDLTRLAKAYRFGLDMTYPAIRDALVVGGRQYRFPCNVNVQAILYNKRVFDDHHVPYPKPNWTWDDFVAAGKAIVSTPSDSGRKHFGLATVGQQGFYNDLLASRGGTYFSADKRRCVLDSPEAIAAMQQYYDLMFRDEILPRPSEAAAMSSQGGWGSGGINWFSNGDAAMICIGRWYIIQMANFPELRGNVGAVREPRFPGQPSRAMAGTRAAGINARTAHPEAAAAFLSYLASPTYAALVVKDGDALPPSPATAGGGQALVNSAVPDPEFHQVFVDAIANATTQDLSPYVDATIVNRWTVERINEVENQVTTPAEAMRSLTAEINRAIAINLSRRPDLRALAERK